MSQLGPSQLLSAWRTAERRLSSRDPDATDFEDMLREAERLRMEYVATTANDGSLVGDYRQHVGIGPEGTRFG